MATECEKEPAAPFMNARIAALRARLAGRGADAFFSLDPPTNTYLTGFRGTTSAVLVTAGDAVLLCDFRYTEQAQQQVSGCRVVEITGIMEVRVGEWLAKLDSRSALFEPERITFGRHEAVRAAAPGIALVVPRTRIAYARLGPSPYLPGSWPHLSPPRVRPHRVFRRPARGISMRPRREVVLKHNLQISIADVHCTSPVEIYT